MVLDQCPPETLKVPCGRGPVAPASLCGVYDDRVDAGTLMFVAAVEITLSRCVTLHTGLRLRTRSYISSGSVEASETWPWRQRSS